MTNTAISCHTQASGFDAYPDDLVGTPGDIEYGMIELLKLQGKLPQEMTGINP
ncbi:hypothetical protein [Dysgonomonas reticulitermitis]